MNCLETQNLMDAFVDTELDLARSLELERHLESCADCSRALRAQQALKRVLDPEALRYAASSRQRRTLRHALKSATPVQPRFQFRWLALGAAAALIALLALLLPGRLGSGREEQLAQEITSSHIRSLMERHLTDVASTDQHTVKPWFDGRLDFAPPVRDFAAEGFPLAGGRLDYLGGRPVAALVYLRQKHTINLFVWPAGQNQDRRESPIRRQGYSLLHWRSNAMEFWAVSDLNEGELQAFASLCQN